MSVSGPIRPGPIEKKVVEVGDFPFFADKVESTVERDTQAINGPSTLKTGAVVKSESYTGTLEFEGRFVSEEIRNIVYDETGVPNPLDIEVRSMFEEHHLFTFEDAMVTGVHPHDDADSHKTTLELTAVGITKGGQP